MAKKKKSSQETPRATLTRLAKMKTPFGAQEIKDLLRCLNESDPDSLVGQATRYDAQRLAYEQDLEQQRLLALELVMKWLLGWRRSDYQRKTVDYRKWPLNTTGLLGDPIGVCPICGKKGEIQKPNSQFKFGGSTMHVVEPFMLGVDIKEFCEWVPTPEPKDGMVRRAQLSLIVPGHMFQQFMQKQYHNQPFTMPDGSVGKTTVELTPPPLPPDVP